MKMPAISAGSEKLLDDYGVHHLTMLATDQAAKAIHDAFLPAQETLRALYDARQAAERALTAAEALSQAAEQSLEDKLRDIEGQLLLAVRKNREADPYKATFPHGLMAALSPRGRAQITEAKRILSLLSPPATPALPAPAEPAPVEPAPAEPAPAVLQGVPDAVKALLADLHAGIETLRVRLDATDAADTAAVAAMTSELMQRRVWREQYRKDYGLLIALYPNNKRKVEGYFKSQRAKKKKPTE